MTVSTTGSLVLGQVDGLRGGLTGPTGPTINYVAGNQNGLLEAEASGLAIDTANSKYYMAKGGSTWYNIGSRT